MLQPSTFTYVPGITGNTLNSAVRSATIANTPPVITPGILVWQTVLSLLYQDYINALGPVVDEYLDEAEVQWTGGAPTYIQFPPIDITLFNVLVASSGSLIYNNIISGCKNADLSLIGSIVWNIVLSQIFSDMTSILDESITNSANQAAALVPPGAIVSPHVGTSQMLQAVLEIPYNKSNLQTDLQVFWDQYNIQQAANILDSKIKSDCKNVDQSGQGVIVWTDLLACIAQQINNSLPYALQQFLTGTQNFFVASGSPGLTAQVTQKLITRGLGVGAPLLITQGLYGLSGSSIQASLASIAGLVF